MRKMILSLVISLMLFSCDSGQQEVIVIPKDYRGYILIIFNQKDGRPTKYEGKKRVYDIPQKGILKTQFEANYGNVGFSTFYYEEILEKNKLSSYVEMEKIPDDTVVGFRGPVGTLKKSENDNERIEFVEFYVGDKSEIKFAKEEIKKINLLELVDK